VCAVALSNLAASAPCHNATLFFCTLPIRHLPCSSRRRRQRWGIASWVASTAALPFPRGHTRIELGQQRCADRKKSKPNRIEIELWIEKSNRNRSKSIKPNRNITTRYYIVIIQEKCHSSVCLVHTFNINKNCKNEFLYMKETHIAVKFAERL